MLIRLSHDRLDGKELYNIKYEHETPHLARSFFRAQAVLRIVALG